VVSRFSQNCTDSRLPRTAVTLTAAIPAPVHVQLASSRGKAMAQPRCGRRACCSHGEVRPSPGGGVVHVQVGEEAWPDAAHQSLVLLSGHEVKAIRCLCLFQTRTTNIKSAWRPGQSTAASPFTRVQVALGSVQSSRQQSSVPRVGVSGAPTFSRDRDGIERLVSFGFNWALVRAR
jgi:hypothetical protein